MEFPTSPCSLVMRAARCFYCSNSHVGDELTLGDAFGIRHCEDHRATAKRDSRAYLHERRIVIVRDAASHAVLGPFLELFHSDTWIRRSGGNLENGWKAPFATADLLAEPCKRTLPLFVFLEGEWRIKLRLGEELAKAVGLSAFEEPEVAALNNHAIQEQVGRIRALLEEGIYKADYEAQLGVTPSTVRESDGIIHAFYNGAPVRMWA